MLSPPALKDNMSMFSQCHRNNKLPFFLQSDVKTFNPTHNECQEHSKGLKPFVLWIHNTNTWCIMDPLHHSDIGEVL